MDRLDIEGDAAERALLSTGSLVSSPAHRTRRARTDVLVIACVALLAGGFLAQHLTGHRDAAPSGRQASTGGRHAVNVTGPRAFALRSGAGAADVVVTRAERLPDGSTGSALALFLRLHVSAGAETVTTETFAVTAAGGATPIPASDVTVLAPDSRVVPSAGGFRIAAPASVGLVVILDVPPGDHVVSVVGDTPGRTPASFAVGG